MNKSTLVRTWHSFRMVTLLSSGKRANYIKKHGIFHHIGENCTINDRKIPLYPNMISLGDNVHLASKVLFVTHDAIHLLMNNMNNYSFQEKIGCIEIGNNVFVGSNTTILYDVRIGSNVIIGAGSLVNKNIPDNTVAVGNPARVIGTFDDYYLKRKTSLFYPENLTPKRHSITKELEEWFWNSSK